MRASIHGRTVHRRELNRGLLGLGVVQLSCLGAAKFNYQSLSSGVCLHIVESHSMALVGSGFRVVKSLGYDVSSSIQVGVSEN